MKIFKKCLLTSMLVEMDGQGHYEKHYYKLENQICSVVGLQVPVLYLLHQSTTRLSFMELHF